MKKTIHKVRQQPYHIREMVVWGISLVVFVAIGIIWFVNFQDYTYALLNPQEVEEQNTAVAEEEESSPLADLLSPVTDLKASIFEFVNTVRDKTEEFKERERIPQNLPLSE